jgi:lipopolysaccharide/colanic/teichoic acid biosynthesis glycosyltransferase
VGKRAFDIALSLTAIVVFLPFFGIIALLIKIDSAGPVFFKQERIGRGFRPFFIYKFRTMVKDAPRLGRDITVGDDPRITRVGRFLRRTKLDEVPQLINVLKGDMSLVGPRPELPRYVEAFRGQYEQILAVRPGLTDLASLRFIDEAAVLAQASDPEDAYREIVLPKKLALARRYVRERSWRLDVMLLVRTLDRLLTRS